MTTPPLAEVAPTAWHPVVAGLLQALRPAASGAVRLAAAARDVAEAALAAAAPAELLAIVTDLCVAAEALRARLPQSPVGDELMALACAQTKRLQQIVGADRLGMPASARGQNLRDSLPALLATERPAGSVSPFALALTARARP